jgi:hypothetical protein
MKQVYRACRTQTIYYKAVEKCICRESKSVICTAKTFYFVSIINIVR